MTYTILLTLTFFITVATLAPMLRISHWVIRSGDFPRLQLAFVAAALLIAECVLLDWTATRSWFAIVPTLGALIVQLWWVLPYTPLAPKEVKSAQDDQSDNKITILTSNVLTTNRQSDKLIALVKRYQPDVLVTLESDKWWEEQLSVLEQDMPHTVKCPLDNLYGMHVYSRLPMNDTSLSFLVEEDVPSVHTTLTLPNKRIIRAHFLHPAPPSPTENTESDERDAEIEIVGRSVADATLPVIVTGDLNDVAWSKTTRLFRKVSGLLDPRIGRGVFCTFHADYVFLRWPLDHVFHSKHFTLNFMKRMPSIGSDHFPLLTQLSLTPEYGADQESVECDEEDKQMAKEMAQEKGVSKEDVPEPGIGSRA